MSKYRIILIYIILHCFSSVVNAQNSDIFDSLKLQLQSAALDPEEKLEVLFKLSGKAPSLHDQFMFSKQLLAEASKAQNITYIIKGHQCLGVSYRLNGALSKSFESLFKGAQLALEHKSERLLSDIYTEISASYTLSGDSKKAVEYGEKSIQILKKSAHTVELGIGLLNLGYDHYLLENYSRALDYYREAETLFEEFELSLGLAYVIGNRALVFWRTGNSTTAKEELQKAIDQLTAFDDRYAIADYSLQFGSILLEEGDLNGAENWAEKGLELARSEGFREQLRDGNLLAFNIYKKRKAFEKGLLYFAEYHAYKDSIYNQETADLLANIHSEFELAQKQAEVELLLAQRKNNRLVIAGAAILVFSLILISLIIFRFYRSKVRLNQQLQEQRSELIDLNDTKDKFFSIISHDLRGPIGVVSGLASTMKKQVDDLSIDDLKEMINHVDNSANNLVKLLDNLLHWSLQQRGSLPYVPEAVDAEAACNEILNLFEEMASGKSIQMHLDVKEQIQLHVDKNGLSTILRNLINNAIKFSNEKSDIYIVIKKEDTFASISVTDQGIGMSEEQVANLLDSKVTISTEGTSGETGMGIGLQLVKEFTHINKGKMNVQSIPESGTTFKLLLPMLKS